MSIADFRAHLRGGFLLAAALAAGGMAAEAGEQATSLTSTAVAEARLKVSGSKSSQFQYTFLDGPNTGFFTNGLTRRESLDLKLSGALEGGIKVLGAFQQSDDLLDDKMSLSLATRNWELFFGDLNAELPGAETVLRPQSLSGARFSGKLPNFGWTALAAVPKGQSRYVRIPGNGTQGPYLLGAAPVVPESESVYLDKVKLLRGSDYDVDYFNGHIVFKTAVAEPHRLIEVVFQCRDTPYERHLYGLQLFVKPFDTITLRSSAAFQGDRQAALFSPLSATAVPSAPGTHYALGEVAEYEDKHGKVSAEYAFAERNLNNFTGDYRHGHAGRAALDYELGPFRVKSAYQRHSESFQPIGGVDQGEDLLGYGGSLDYRPGPAFQALGSYDFSRRNLSTGALSQADGKAQAALTPKGLPHGKYQYLDEAREDAALSSSLGALLQRSRRHIGELSQDIGVGRLAIQGEWEQLNGQSSLSGVTATPRLQSLAATGTGTLSLDRLSWLAAVLSATYRNGRLEDPDYAANNLDFISRQLKADSSLRAGDFMTLAGGGQWMEDPVSGLRNTLNGKLSLRHGTVASLEASHQWDSLQMLVFTSFRPADTRVSSGRAEWSPWRPLSLAVSGSQRETQLKGSSLVPNSQESRAGIVKWAPISSVSLEAGLNLEKFSLLNTADLFLPLQSEQDLNSQKYGAKWALGPSSSLEGAYSITESDKRQQALLLGGYDRARGSTSRFNAGLKSAMSEKIRVNASWRLNRFDQEGSAAAALTLSAMPLSSLTQEAEGLAVQAFLGSARYEDQVIEAKFAWDALPWLSLGLSGAYGSFLRAGVGYSGTSKEGALVGLRFSRVQGEISYAAAQTAGASQDSQHQVAGNVVWKAHEVVTVTLRGEYTSAGQSQATRASLNVTESF